MLPHHHPNPPVNTGDFSDHTKKATRPIERDVIDSFQVAFRLRARAVPMKISGSILVLLLTVVSANFGDAQQPSPIPTGSPIATPTPTATPSPTASPTPAATPLPPSGLRILH
jgi:hypothetical protein